MVVDFTRFLRNWFNNYSCWRKETRMANAWILLKNLFRHILLALYAFSLKTLQRFISFKLDNGCRCNGIRYSYNDNPLVYEISLCIFVCDPLGVLDGAIRSSSLDSCLLKSTCYYRLLYIQVDFLSST